VIALVLSAMNKWRRGLKISVALRLYGALRAGTGAPAQLQATRTRHLEVEYHATGSLRVDFMFRRSIRRNR